MDMTLPPLDTCSSYVPVSTTKKPAFCTDRFLTAKSIFEKFPRFPFHVRVDCLNGFSIEIDARSPDVINLRMLERTAIGGLQENKNVSCASVSVINSALFHMQGLRVPSPHAHKRIGVKKDGIHALLAPWNPLPICDQVDFGNEAKSIPPFLSIRERLFLGTEARALAKFVAMGTNVEKMGNIQVVDFPNCFVRIIRSNARVAKYTVICDVKEDQGELRVAQTCFGLKEAAVTAYLYDKYKEKPLRHSVPTLFKYYSALPVIPCEAALHYLAAYPEVAVTKSVEPTVPLRRGVVVPPPAPVG